MNPRFWALDLEMNQPSGKIIQIGAVVGNIRTGEILEHFSEYVNPHEEITPFINTLTGITQANVENAFELETVALNLQTMLTQSNACVSPITWGNGDLWSLKTQIQNKNLFKIYREIDIKTIHQFLRIVNSQSMKAGLEKALISNGLTFVGIPHDAYYDAYNTFMLAHHFFCSFTEKLPNFLHKIT